MHFNASQENNHSYTFLEEFRRPIRGAVMLSAAHEWIVGFPSHFDLQHNWFTLLYRFVSSYENSREVIYKADEHGSTTHERKVPAP